MGSCRGDFRDNNSLSNVVGGEKFIRPESRIDGGATVGRRFYGGDVRPALVAAGPGSVVVIIGNFVFIQDFCHSCAMPAGRQESRNLYNNLIQRKGACHFEVSPKA